MTKEQIDTITSEVQAYVRRRAEQYHESINIINIAVTRAMLLMDIEEYEQMSQSWR